MGEPRTRWIQTSDTDVVIPHRTFVSSPADPKGPKVPDVGEDRDDTRKLATFADRTDLTPPSSGG